MSVKLLSTPGASWQAEWRLFAARVDRQTEIAFRFANTTQAMHGIEAGRFANEVLIPSLGELRYRLEAFMKAHGANLPDEARTVLADALTRGRDFYAKPQGLPGMVALASWLSATRAELEPFMADVDSLRVSIVERAFLHLQRIIVVDPRVAAEWQAAFNVHETRCELLGGTHLLHHGIYAVKTNGEGERTDLVLGTRYVDRPTIRRAAEAMALTEWKRITDASASAYRAAKLQAFDQAVRYGRGLLAGFDIERTRFLVLVTAGVVIDDEDIVHGGVTYRPINIAVRPESPSEGSVFVTAPR